MKDKLKIIEQSSNVKVSVITALASESTMDEQGFITVNRSYKLKCYPTFSKSEIGLSFEAPIVISRLSKGTLQGWAGGYLAKRVNVLAKETSKYVVFVNPAYTSQECPKCHYKSKRNRKGIDFQCRMCDYKNHADLVGAINISRRASSEQKFDPATLAINSERDARKL